MDSQTRGESLRILIELESNLETLKTSLSEAERNSERLDQDLTKVSTLLAEARESLQNSEDSLESVNLKLTEASKALTDSVQSLKDFQRWEVVKIVGVGLACFLVGLLL